MHYLIEETFSCTDPRPCCFSQQASLKGLSWAGNLINLFQVIEQPSLIDLTLKSQYQSSVWFDWGKININLKIEDLYPALFAHPFHHGQLYYRFLSFIAKVLMQPINLINSIGQTPFSAKKILFNIFPFFFFPRSGKLDLSVLCDWINIIDFLMEKSSKCFVAKTRSWKYRVFSKYRDR